jgi:sugar phosphate isomerase/epimerase
VKLSVCPQPFYALGLERALDAIAALGVEALELPVDRRSPLVDLDALLAGGVAALHRQLAARGLKVSAISNHQEGQLLLGPHHRDTEHVHAGTPADRSAFAHERLVRSARLAAELEVGLVIGFVGCEDWTRFFPWPAPDGFEAMIPAFQ